MKNKTFTMIEILVVISIIMVLVGILVPAVSKGLQKAKKQKAKVACKTMLMAIKQYESTYGFLPFTGRGADIMVNSVAADWAKLLVTLAADASDATANPRKIRFLECEYNQAGEPIYQDSWDNDINVALDLDYNNELDADKVDGYVNTGTAGVLKTTIAVWSAGPDALTNATDDHVDNADNLNSWDR